MRPAPCVPRVELDGGPEAPHGGICSRPAYVRRRHSRTYCDLNEVGVASDSDRHTAPSCGGPTDLMGDAMVESEVNESPNGGSVDRRNLRFTMLELTNWRNFTKVDVALQQRMFLVGPNAAGKSNLLDVFRFLADIVTVGGGFQAAVARRGGVSMIRSFAARKNPQVTVKAALGNDRAPEEWTYQLTFGQDNQRRPTIAAERILYRGRELLSRPDAADSEDPDRLRQTYLEQVNANKDFRTVADFFQTTRYMHIVPQLVREPDRSVGRTNDPYGGDFLEQIASTPKRTRDSRLRRITRALQVAVPQLGELDLKQDNRGVWHLRGRYQHWRTFGQWQNEEHFSDGTLRLLGLLWAVTAGTGPLLLEEPELSLHPEVVRQIPQMFARVQRRSGRQIFVSSHSVDMLNDPGIGNDEVLTLIPKSEGTAIAVMNGDQEAARLRDAGIELGEIVRAKTAPSEAAQLSLFGE
jgi:predicted ATPase